MIIGLLAIGPHVYRPFSVSPLLVFSPSLLFAASLSGLAISAKLSLCRLYETVGKGVTPPDGSGTEQDDNDESQSHQDPGDPSECLGGDNLVAVNQTVG